MHSTRRWCMYSGYLRDANAFAGYLKCRFFGVGVELLDDRLFGVLRQIGIQPDILICRTEHPISADEKDKIALPAVKVSVNRDVTRRQGCVYIVR